MPYIFRENVLPFQFPHRVVGFSYVSFFLIFKCDALHCLLRVKGNVWGMPEFGQKKLKYGPDTVLISFYA
ncbi:hypothetical protein ES332_D13G146600v1 [Gossypium tomentosum]|uniref:Uncharacterized protein n=1 Tax=Gossypium tomentosum TaxID=34277 RepID=A0A5D2HX65_GOSTO|nr:hypothetical protein ES332_D13G146600v1 [Gossypium tomentosum]